LTPEVEISPDSLNGTIGENDQSSQTITISNTGTADLEWAIEEAESDCATPGDLPWLSVSPLLGTTAGSSSDAIEVAFDATGLAAGEYNGLLCIATNDADEPTISLAITLTVVENRLYMPAAMGSPLGNP
jgi:hypothetical protein